MKNYRVQLKLRHGEQEYYLPSLVTALNKHEAGKQAIENQAYDSLEWDNDITGAYDRCGEIYLCVSDITEIPDSDYEIVKKYL